MTIGQMLAERLNMASRQRDDIPWTVFDRNLVEKVLEDHQLPMAIKRFLTEEATAKAFSPTRVVEEMFGLHPSSWTLVEHTADTVYRLARMGHVILVGRGAHLITANCPQGFHVRLVAPLALRIKRAANIHGLSETDAETLVHEQDRARSRYVRTHFKTAVEDPLQYHAILNTAAISFEEAARMIADAVIGMERKG